MDINPGPPPSENPLLHIQGQADLDEDRPLAFAAWIEGVGHYTIQVKGGTYCPRHRNRGERT